MKGRNRWEGNIWCYSIYSSSKQSASGLTDDVGGVWRIIVDEVRSKRGAGGERLAKSSALPNNDFIQITPFPSSTQQLHQHYMCKDIRELRLVDETQSCWIDLLSNRTS
jgi:hypothetical protein